MSEWISVEDRLPEINQAVAMINIKRFENTHFDRNIYDCGYLSEWGSHKSWSIRGERSCEISAYTHWMPLPPPPQGAY